MDRTIGGRYRIDRALGAGGMGAVYQAHDTSTDRDVALKLMRTDQTEDGRRRRGELRFRREYHTLASLQHPHIVEVHDYGLHTEGPFYTMELLSGEDLRDLIRAEGPLATKRTCRILRDVVAALSLMHARGLVHRDLSPRNVRVTESGRAKLFDFGVLANVGIAGEVAGTPAFAAPEMLRGQPIDGRADLYAVGVLAYVLLTGRAPYPARSMVELETHWGKPLTPPSEHNPDVPAQLEALVLDLLRLEPLARPRSAAVVYDRLSAAAGLEPDLGAKLEAGFLPSAAIVGRDQELATMRAELSKARHGETGTFYVEAESGAGKSRLLEELVLRAKLDGAHCVLVSGETSTGAPFGVAKSLARELFHHAPEEAAATAEPLAAQLGKILPTVRKRFRVKLEEDSGDPYEDRMRMQRVFAEWIAAVAAKKPLAILVDDLQRVDEASATVFASLTRADAPGLLLGFALRIGETVRAPSALRVIKRVQPRVRLGGLSEGAIEDLLRSLFGDVAHLGRLAKWMHRQTDGSPLHCTELARHLVDAGIVRFSEGTWVIPKQVPQEVAPEGLAAAMESRVGRLSEHARSVAESISVHGGEMSLDLVVDLAADVEASGTDLVLAAIDELVQEGVVVDEGERLRFRHDSLREALLRQLTPDRRTQLHRRVAGALLDEATHQGGGLDPAEEVDVGWHLFHGGDRKRGAEYLSRAGVRLFEAQAHADCLAPMQAALEVFEEEGRPEVECMQLRVKLLTAGWVSDREVGLAHAEQALASWSHYCGLTLAGRLRRYLGVHLAFFCGLVTCTFRWLKSLGKAPSPMAALGQFALAVGYACALANASNHPDRLRALCATTEPFRAFKGNPPYTVYLLVHAMPDLILGRLDDGARKLSEATRLVTRRFLSPLTKWERVLGEAAVRGLRALIDLNTLNPRLFEDLERIRELDLRYYDLVVETTRVNYHRYRGEEDVAQAMETACEEQAIQLGSWSTDVQALVFAHPAYAFCHDVEGLKRCIDELERRCQEGFAFEDRLAATRAEYHRERGEYERAMETALPMYRSLRAENFLMRQYIGSTVAQISLEAHRYEEAQRVAREVLAVGDENDAVVIMPRLRAERTLALAEYALGDVRGAIHRLDEAIATAERLDWPPLAGELHEARARIALQEDDSITYHAHEQQAAQWLEATGNPGLIAVVRRLRDWARAHRGERAKRRKRAPSAGSSEITLDAETIAGTASRSRVGSRSAADAESADSMQSDASDAPTVAPSTSRRPRRESSSAIDEATVASKPAAIAERSRTDDGSGDDLGDDETYVDVGSG